MKYLKKLVTVLLVAALVVSLGGSALACTTIAAGKDATADGSVLVAHTCDGWYDHRIQIVEGGTHEEGEMVDIYNDPCADTRAVPELVGQIPQAPETYTYFNIAYPFMNEKGVVISEFTWGGTDEVFCPNGMMVIANLEQIGLARAATARECVQVMGEFAEQYGYCDGGECLLVADNNEVWIFEICGGGPQWTADSGAPGAHWAARRLPDDQVFVGANRSRMGVIDFDDPDNFMWSTDITALPEQLGWWKEGEEFNYSKLFNPEPYGYEFYASRREWRAFSLLAPSQDFQVLGRQDHYDFSITPDEPVTVQNIMDIYSDHLEGTEYDLTQGLAAGPFHDPTRWQGGAKPEAAAEEDWERAIAQYRCSYSFVAELRPDLPGEIGSLMWFGEDAPDTTVYVPIYAGTTEVPAEWSTGDRYHFDPSCAWWAFNFVNNWANLRWDAMYADIRAEKAKYEDEFFASHADVEAEALELYNAGDIDGARAVLTEYVNDNMNKVNEGWWDFAWTLVGRYQDGMVVGDGYGGSAGASDYPSEWMEEVGRNQVGAAAGGNAGDDYETPGYPTDWLEAVGYGQTSLADKADLGIE